MSHSDPAPGHRTFARRMRREPTDAERVLWRLLRGRRLAALNWRRQVPLGRYIVDFMCFEAKLVVECDGSQHAESVGDIVRDAWLASQGFCVLRIWNHDVLHARRMVEDTILAAAGLPV